VKTETSLAWTATVTRDAQDLPDRWADIGYSQVLRLRVSRVKLTYRRESGAWALIRTEISGEKYRELASGRRSEKGSGELTYHGGRLPEAYHWMVYEMRTLADAQWYGY